MSFEKIEIEDKGNWALVKINRPKVMNSLNNEVLTELKMAIKELNQNDEIKVIAITGKGKAFVAGADISAMKEMDNFEAKEFAKLGHETFRTIEESSKPIIAGINGFALGGGCELALACDIRIASNKAQFGQPEINLGIIPGFGGTQRLSKIVGEAKAKELILTGKKIKAEEALKIGLVNEVTTKDELLIRLEEMATKIASNSSLILKIAKKAVNRGLEKDILEGTKLEADLFSLCFTTEDQKEGMNAFLNKREPNFSGK
ncbi:enoyl-CoA hydratase-related protein [Sporohalobacter salinus]|uniref:enoyl-CoA hydratase-related protein n=1 Tax=Sporohalobacter salinus TaxID=1494606 RepID=UPI0019613FA7|nr:enoyl-CoA hydratase-related protein [Sporohalobacter salinus]MBM7622640.1 enoyl-CoA hydratase [Sporohalobacter salinus]